MFGVAVVIIAAKQPFIYCCYCYYYCLVLGGPQQAVFRAKCWLRAQNHSCWVQGPYVVPRMDGAWTSALPTVPSLCLLLLFLSRDQEGRITALLQGQVWARALLYV